MHYVITRLRIEELKFETVVTIPTPLIGEIPEHMVAHFFKLFPSATKLEFFDGDNVRVYEKKETPQPNEPKKIITA